MARVPLLILLATCQVDKLTNTPPPIATLSLAPDQVRDSAAVGSLGVNHDSLAVVNTGPGTLSWSARLAMGEPWLAFVGPTGGTAPAKLRLAFNPAGLPTGIYRDTVVVAAENAAGSPGRVPVEFVVHPCLAVPIVPPAQLTDSITTWDCAAPHRPTGFARVYAFSAQANDSISVVMSSTPLNAYLVLDSSTTPTAPPLALNDSCSGGGRDACLPYQLLRTAGTYLIEATSAASGETGRFTLSVTRPRPPAAPASLAQLRTDSVTSVPVGGSTDQAGIVLRGVVSDPDLSDTLRLEVEVQPVGTPFSGVATAASGRLAAGVSAFVAVGGLANNTAYHWQARTVDQTGRASAWTAFGANAETDGDVVTTIPQPPAPPTDTVQFQSDGVTASPVVQVVAQDALGNTLTSFNGSVTVALASNPGGDTLSGTKTVAAQNGVASFGGLSVAHAGAGYTLQASATISGTTLTVTSNPFTISPAVAKRLVFTGQPSTSPAGAAITPAIQVTARDSFGNTATGFAANVTLAIGNNPGGGALSGTPTQTAVGGVASFSGLTINKAGIGYTLTAAAT